MDNFQRKLRILIATGSTIGFLGGWALLAHAGKPVSTLSATSAGGTTDSINMNLQPLDFNALESGSSSINVQNFAPPSFQSFGGTRLRTGGS